MTRLALALLCAAGSAAMAAGETRAEDTKADSLKDSLVYKAAADLSYRKGEYALSFEESRRCLDLDPQNKECDALLKLATSKINADKKLAPHKPTLNNDELVDMRNLPEKKVPPQRGSKEKTKSTALKPAAPTSEENAKAAAQHWNAGLIYYQQGQYDKTKHEWTLCKQLDPFNSDCVSGLLRVDQQFGGP